MFLVFVLLGMALSTFRLHGVSLQIAEPGNDLSETELGLANLLAGCSFTGTPSVTHGSNLSDFILLEIPFLEAALNAHKVIKVRAVQFTTRALAGRFSTSVKLFVDSAALCSNLR
jgi:hypothetical protein